ncbi:MAG: SH3 domain-containing protein [Deltaproteobacteria bacterium]|nr:SH3 domain-containing protein [Deltaproteobacteria bacterium]MBN2671467.1 SH3 domain-containing protein [Deltaproteobacteria bacterium]
MENKLPIPKPTKEKNATGEIAKVLILAVISFIAGFALIFFFLRPSGPDVAPDELPSTESNGQAVADTPDTPAAGTAPKSAVETVSPGETPDGVTQPSEPHYLKCWDKTGIENDGAECDRLLKLENRFTERLYVVNECKTAEAGEAADGKLVVACEVNFDTQSISFWHGAASDIRNASDIGDCLRNKLAGLPLEAIDHEFSRYRIYFGVQFGVAAPAVAAGSEAAESDGDNEMSFAEGPTAPPEGKGRLVNVAKDRVRVRRSPVDGEVFGKISTGNKVRLLKQENGWCHIVTPNNNEGWMICSALEL